MYILSNLFKFLIFLLIYLVSNINRMALVVKTEKAMAPHSSTLAWKIPWTKEPGRLAVHGVAKSRA